MGDRVLFQVIKDPHIDRYTKEGNPRQCSPVIYGHWSGDEAPAICERLKARMADRPGDVEYTAARLVQELIEGREGNLGFGIWNRDTPLTADDSHGHGGIVLVYVHDDGPLTFKAIGGYLGTGPNGTRVYIAEEAAP